MPLFTTLEGTFGYGRPSPQVQPALIGQIYLDAGVATSYPGTGTIWSNIGSAGAAYRFTLANSPTFSTIVYNGARNSTISFDGVNDYASPSTSMLTLAQASAWSETREYWVYWRGSPGCLTMENGATVPDTNWYDAQAAMSNTNLTYSVWQGGAMTPYIVYSTLTSNAWNHIVWQHRKSTNTLMAYVNGVQTYSNAAVTRITSDSASREFYTILCAPSGTNFGNGSASYLGANLAIYRWYNRILTPAEISTNFATDKNRFGAATSTIVTNGILLHLDGGNSSSYGGSGTTWTDLTGNARNATLVNSPTYSVTGGGYFSFLDTSFQYATIADIGDRSQWTVEAWFRLSASLTGKVTAVVTNQFNLTNKLNFSLGTNRAPTSYNLCAGYFNGAWRTTTGFTPSTDVWYQVVGTNDGTVINQYVNGTLDTSLTYTGTSQTGGEIRIARRWDEPANVASNFLKGDVAIVRIYSRALSAAEVLQNYNVNRARFGL